MSLAETTTRGSRASKVRKPGKPRKPRSQVTEGGAVAEAGPPVGIDLAYARDTPIAVGKAKVRKTLTLDPDVVQALESAGSTGPGLSASVNAILRDYVEKAIRNTALHALAADMATQFGEPDPDEVSQLLELLHQ